ncbi:DHH family phosphoesterase [Bacillaceae bacterium]
MPKFLFKRWHGYHMIIALGFCLLLIAILATYHWVYGVAGALVFSALVYFTWKAELAFRKDLQRYVATLSYRVKKAGEELLHEMPIGIVLYNEHKVVEWHNPVMLKITGEDTLIGKKLTETIPPLDKIDWTKKKAEIALQGRIYEVTSRPEERLLYFRDITEYRELLKRYKAEQVVFSIIHLDNLDEVSQGMDEQSRSLLLTNVTGAITDWAAKHGIFLRRYASDKFLAVMDQATLEELEQSRFDILDVVREMTAGNKIPMTLSIGVGAGADSFIELGELAQSSLDIALGRGGDQAAVKFGKRISFYGGKSNAVEKRTRVRARVISHALRDLIQESEQVMIMGHEVPDMDAIGAAIGVLKAVRVNQRNGYIVLDEPNPSIANLLEEIARHEELREHFITPEEAVQMNTPHTLIIVVDTHRPSMTIEPRLLTESNRVVVIDHHRRGEEFVKDPTLVYLEPYASSTCELVTELLQYQSDHLTMDPLEATALLAGIVVDTKSFALRTGSRTFEAASFLRRNGADTSHVQRLLKEDLAQFMKRARLIQNAVILYDKIALAVGDPDERYGQVLIAQAADTLLTLSGISASFVVSLRPDGKVSISARSLGDINVQTIMERLGGGGHLTNAAVQLENITLEEAEQRLRDVLEELHREGGL